jgi:hypothetical protein
MLRSELTEHNFICPYCENRIAAVISYHGHTPHHGDYAVCPCGGIGIFTDHLNKDTRGWRIRKPNRKEALKIYCDAEVREIQQKQGVSH